MFKRFEARLGIYPSRGSIGKRPSKAHPLAIATTNVAILSLVLIALLSSSALAQAPLTVKSDAFASGQYIPEEYTCMGDNKSPALSWQNLPAATKSLALIVADPDAPMGTFIHWVIYSIPPSRHGLPEGVPKKNVVSGVGVQGTNSAGRIGYTGPCPPPGRPHHYHFRLYALDFVPEARAGLAAEELEKLMAGHILATGETVGLFAR